MSKYLFPKFTCNCQRPESLIRIAMLLFISTKILDPLKIRDHVSISFYYSPLLFNTWLLQAKWVSLLTFNIHSTDAYWAPTMGHTQCWEHREDMVPVLSLTNKWKAICTYISNSQFGGVDLNWVSYLNAFHGGPPENWTKIFFQVDISRHRLIAQ